MKKTSTTKKSTTKKNKTMKRRKVVLVYTVEHEALSPGWMVEKWPPFPKRENAFETVKFIESRPGDVVLPREDAQKAADYSRLRNDFIDALAALAALRDAVRKSDREAAIKMRDAVLAKTTPLRGDR